MYHLRKARRKLLSAFTQSPKQPEPEPVSLDPDYSEKLQALVKNATRALLPDHGEALLSFRARGTMRPALQRQWQMPGSRGRRIARADALLARAVPAAAAPQPPFAAAVPAAAHRALEADEADAERLLRSARVRSMDVNVDDARALCRFFSVTDSFVRGYFEATAALAGADACTSERGPHRTAAVRAMERFTAARAAFCRRQGLHELDQLLSRASDARAATLAATGTEAQTPCAPRSVRVDNIAGKLAEAPGGPFLVLFLARGVAESRRCARDWAWKVMFPNSYRVQRPACMLRMTRAFYVVHGTHAVLFDAAESEYRIMFMSRPEDISIKFQGHLELK